MKEVVTVAWDDLDLAAGRERRTAAEDTVTLLITVVSEDGSRDQDIEVELDLTAAHTEELLSAARKYVAAGRSLRSPRSPRPRSVSPLDKLCPFPAGSPERRQFLDGLRAWVRDLGIADGSGGKYRKKTLQDYMASAAYLGSGLAEKAA